MKLGITGHQDLGDSFIINWIEKEILTALNGLRIEKAFSSLAAGADQLFAALVLSIHVPLIAVIPSHHYERTFAADNLERYYLLLKQASQIVQLAFEYPSEAAFYKAGKRIVEECDILFAVWNNRPAKGLGGTADIVDYAKLLNKKVIHFNPVTQTVDYIQ